MDCALLMICAHWVPLTESNFNPLTQQRRVQKVQFNIVSTQFDLSCSLFGARERESSLIGITLLMVIETRLTQRCCIIIILTLTPSANRKALNKSGAVHIHIAYNKSSPCNILIFLQCPSRARLPTFNTADVSISNKCMLRARGAIALSHLKKHNKTFQMHNAAA